MRSTWFFASAFALVACASQPTREPGTPQNLPPPSTSDVTRATTVTGTSADSRVAANAPQATGPGDQLPDPGAPEDGCTWRPIVRCDVPNVPAGTGLPAPYDNCPKDVPVLKEHSIPEQRTAQFSPKATRAARAYKANVCCYVEYTVERCQ